MPLDPNNTDAKACRYWGGIFLALATLGEIGCGFGYHFGASNPKLELAASIIGVIGVVAPGVCVGLVAFCPHIKLRKLV